MMARGNRNWELDEGGQRGENEDILNSANNKHKVKK